MSSAFIDTSLEYAITNWLLVMFKSSTMPSIFALPMFVRSKKEIKYRKDSHGIRYQSSFRISFLSYCDISVDSMIEDIHMSKYQRSLLLRAEVRIRICW